MIAPLILALTLTPAHAGLIDQARRVYAKCAGKLMPLTRHNAGQAVTLRTGERVPMRYAADVVRLSLEVLIKKNTVSAAEDLVRLARDPAHAVSAETKSILRRHRLLRANGRVPAEVAPVLRASLKGEGDRVTIVSPAALPALTDDGVREYLARVDRHLVAGLVDLAKSHGLNVTAATSPPTFDGPRPPRDGTLIVDLGVADRPITLLTPIGRLAVFQTDEFRDPAALTAFKADARKRLALIPIDLGADTSPDLMAALDDLGGGKFPLPDEGADATQPAVRTLVESWNALKPSARGPLDQEP